MRLGRPPFVWLESHSPKVRIKSKQIMETGNQDWSYEMISHESLAMIGALMSKKLIPRHCHFWVSGSVRSHRQQSRQQSATGESWPAGQHSTGTQTDGCTTDVPLRRPRIGTGKDHRAPSPSFRHLLHDRLLLVPLRLPRPPGKNEEGCCRHVRTGNAKLSV